MVSSPVEFSGVPRRAWEPCIPREPAGLTTTSRYRPLHLMGHRAQPTATGPGAEGPGGASEESHSQGAQWVPLFSPDHCPGPQTSSTDQSLP